MASKKSKRGRPPMKQGQAKSILIQVRVTPEEAKAIEEQASQSQKPRSEWIRRRLVQPGEAKSQPKPEEPKPQPPANA